MRIGWATPFNVRSAIGKFSRIVCEELRERGHDVVVIRLESGSELGLEPIDCRIPLISAPECDSTKFDLLIGNFGNHAPYHAHIMTLVAQHALLGIFHDMEMRDFAWGLKQRHQLTVPILIGSEHELEASDIDDMVDPAARPVLAALAAMTCGAIIHGPHYLETVSAYCPGPVEVVPLCYPDTGTGREPRPPKPGRRVTIFGVINDYKQPGRVLEALAQLKPRLGPIELHLAGSAEDRVRDALLAKAEKLGLNPPIFHGYVSDDALQAIIENSHAVCCLRYPVTEGGSASLVTALFRARPLIISNIASYSMVPDELAHKVSYGEDPDDVAAALANIFANPAAAEAKAVKARVWASDKFSASSYVDALEPMLRSAQRHASLAKTARELIGSVRMSGQEPDMGAVEAFAEVLDWMEASPE